MEVKNVLIKIPKVFDPNKLLNESTIMLNGKETIDPKHYYDGVLLSDGSKQIVNRHYYFNSNVQIFPKYIVVTVVVIKEVINKMENSFFVLTFILQMEAWKRL